MPSPKPPQKYHPRGTRPRSNARTKNRKHKKSSSLQAADATNAGHQSRLIVADMAHSLEKGKRQNGEQRDPFRTRFGRLLRPGGREKMYGKGKSCSELGRCIWSSQTGEEVLSFLQFS